MIQRQVTVGDLEVSKLIPQSGVWVPGRVRFTIQQQFQASKILKCVLHLRSCSPVMCRKGNERLKELRRWKESSSARCMLKDKEGKRWAIQGLLVLVSFLSLFGFSLPAQFWPMSKFSREHPGATPTAAKILNSTVNLALEIQLVCCKQGARGRSEWEREAECKWKW